MACTRRTRDMPHTFQSVFVAERRVRDTERRKREPDDRNGNRQARATAVPPRHYGNDGRSHDDRPVGRLHPLRIAREAFQLRPLSIDRAVVRVRDFPWRLWVRHTRPVHVRHVVAGDEAALRDLRLASLQSDPEAFGSTYERDAARPREWWADWAARSQSGRTDRTFVVTTNEGRWVGLAMVKLDDAGPRSAELLAMWVAPEARGSGLSDRLCDACAAWAREHGCAELGLSVAVGNERARRAYTRAGFRDVATAKWSRADRTLDVVVMSRPL
jgi:RimJ/RimL family protein N-acetyltransferase